MPAIRSLSAAAGLAGLRSRWRRFLEVDCPDLMQGYRRGREIDPERLVLPTGPARIGSLQRHRPLVEAAMQRDLDHVLGVVAGAAVEDLAALVRLTTGGRLAELRRLTDATGCIPGPGFAGSEDVAASGARRTLPTLRHGCRRILGGKGPDR